MSKIGYWMTMSEGTLMLGYLAYILIMGLASSKNTLWLLPEYVAMPLFILLVVAVPLFYLYKNRQLFE